MSRKEKRTPPSAEEQQWIMFYACIICYWLLVGGFKLNMCVCLCYFRLKSFYMPQLLAGEVVAFHVNFHISDVSALTINYF